MSTIEIIENKISYIRQQMAFAEQFKRYSYEDILKNPMLKGALERNLYIIAQAVIDLAEALVAFTNFRKPTTMRDAFDILQEEGVLGREFVENFVKIVGFRNAIAHDYQKLDFKKVYDVLQEKLPQVEQFLEYIKKYLRL